MFPGATTCKARVRGRVVSYAVVIATGVTAGRHRDALSCDVSDVSTQDSWEQFLSGLREHGLDAVQPVVPDQHRGLVSASKQTVAGASWQRCRVHVLRDVPAKVSESRAEAVAAMARTTFIHPTPALLGE